MIKYLDLKKITAMHAAEIHEAVARVVDSGWYLHGGETEAFEKAYANYIGVKHCVACGNGLDSLTLILRAYKALGYMQEGDEVIVPANTFIATLLAVTENGLKPVLVEPRIDTFQIDDELIEKAITHRTRAVIIVNLYGCYAYTPKIDALCDTYGLKLIEDNAQAQGCAYIQRGKKTLLDIRATGALGDAAGHSFYPGKNLGALGDAGAVTTNDDQLAETVRRMANYGQKRKYIFEYAGRNSRMDELQAAVLRVKLRHLDEDNERRLKIALRYHEEVNNRRLTMPCEEFIYHSVHHIFPVLTPDRKRLQAYLLDKGIETLIHYPVPPHRQECYPELAALDLPVTDRICNEELSIPLNQAMTDEEVGQVIDALNTFH